MKKEEYKLYFKGDKNLVINNETINDFSKKVGVSRETISRIINKKQSCGKYLAYYMCKTANEDYEIEDLFERV